MAAKRAKKTITGKANLAISIAPGLVEQLKEVATLENCSVSALVQRCVEEYLPVIRSSPTLENSYRLDMLLGRLSSAVTTADMRQCGVRPFKVEFGMNGQISISLIQHRDIEGKPIPLELEDVYGPSREEGETDDMHNDRVAKYYAERFHLGNHAPDNEKTELSQDKLGNPTLVHKVPLTPVKEALRKSKS